MKESKKEGKENRIISAVSLMHMGLSVEAGRVCLEKFSKRLLENAYLLIEVLSWLKPKNIPNN